MKQRTAPAFRVGMLLGPVALCLALAASPAAAADMPVDPTDETLLLDGAATDIAVMSDFVLEGGVEVVDGNGAVDSDVALSPNSGKTRSAASARAGCSWRTWIAPGTATWHTSVDGCSLIGTTATATAGYDFTVDGNSQGRGCLKGRGCYYQSYPGGGSWYQTYRSIGCQNGGSSGGGSVLWGKVASVKKVQMYAASSPVGVAGIFK